MSKQVSAQETIEDKLRRQIDILIQHYGAEAKGHLYSKRKAIREPYLDKIMAIITTETTNAELKGRMDELRLLKENKWTPTARLNRLAALQKQQPSQQEEEV